MCKIGIRRVHLICVSRTVIRCSVIDFSCTWVVLEAFSCMPDINICSVVYIAGAGLAVFFGWPGLGVV